MFTVFATGPATAGTAVTADGKTWRRGVRPRRTADRLSQRSVVLPHAPPTPSPAAPIAPQPLVRARVRAFGFRCRPPAPAGQSAHRMFFCRRTEAMGPHQFRFRGTSGTDNRPNPL
jgi:hypothetical protein